MVLSDILVELSDIFADILYKSTKEMVRVLIATSCTLVLTQFAGSGAQAHRYWHIKFCCSLLLLGLFIYLSLMRLIDRCYDTDLQHLKPSQGLCRILPPPPKPAVSHHLPAKFVKMSVKGIKWCREHPVEVASAVSCLLIADFLNVFITIDRLDPLISFLRGLFFPLIKVGKIAWGVIRQHRARTLAQLAADTASGGTAISAKMVTTASINALPAVFVPTGG